MAGTTRRAIRVGDVWDRASVRARREGTTVSEVVRLHLEDYANEVTSVTEELDRIMVRLDAIRKRLES